MTATSMPQGTFSRSGMSVSQEESPGFSRGEDVNLVRLALQTPLESLNPHFQAPNGLFKAGFAPQIPVLLEPIQPLALVRPPSAQHRKRGHRAAIAVVEAIVRREVAVPEY